MALSRFAYCVPVCGIVGWVFEPSLSSNPEAYIDAATDRLERRGPDGRGVWCSQNRSAVFGHRRLAILDVSSTGSQPMKSDCGRFVITFNGEIYNHLGLRAELSRQGLTPLGGWRGTSDTETLLVALKSWGLTRTLEAAVGMFAFALWDEATQELVLARDRLGEKPLYVTRLGSGLGFASELKALEGLPGFDTSIDTAALAAYLRQGYVSAPSTIYVRTAKLLPGSYLRVSERDVAAMAYGGDFLAPYRRFYWELRDVARRGLADPFRGGESQAVDTLGNLLGAAVKGQSLADVPVGAFLSGGIDSTAVVALMQAVSGDRVRTFTIAFDDPEFDESPHAERVAAHLGTEHTTVPMSTADALNKIQELPHIWDEPFADVSQLPTLLVSEVARRHVTVALSGDGGDELFAGYSRYGWTSSAWKRLNRYPVPLRRMGAGLMRAIPESAWNAVSRALPGSLGDRVSGERMHKVATLVGAASPGELYESTLSAWRGPQPLLLGDDPGAHGHWSGYPDLGDILHSLRYRDAVDYMPDDVLVKVDRAAMHVSLETRAPFLDPAVVAFAWSLPSSLLQRAGKGKWVLRQLVHRYVPSELVERPKAGFAVPIHSWLRGSLRDWAEALLQPDKLEAGGLNAKPVVEAWRSHLAGTHDHRYFLWHVLNYLAWRDSRGF